MKALMATILFSALVLSACSKKVEYEISVRRDSNGLCTLTKDMKYDLSGQRISEYLQLCSTPEEK